MSKVTKSVAATVAVVPLTLFVGSRRAQAQSIEINPSSDGLPGGELFQKIVDWGGQVGIWLVVLAFVIGAGMWAAGGLSGSPQTAARGQKAIGVAIVGAILLGGAKAILNLVYQAGGTIS